MTVSQVKIEQRPRLKTFHKKKKEKCGGGGG
jgi:hypothetical protein